MHRKALAVAAAMLIITVIGLAFMGVADAGSNNRGPKPTKTPKPNPTADARNAPASIQLTPDPLRIACDGAAASTLSVRVTDAGGKPVPNGTLVTFSADYGIADPSQAETRNGEAETRIILSPQAAQSFSGAFATVRVGDIEASIRIRCDAPAGCAQFPTSPPCQPPPCPASPPTHPMSPPCEIDPTPCPSHPMSPPCGDPTPDPCSSNGPFSPPCLTATPDDPNPCSDIGAPFSPPCGTPTPTPNAPARFAIDCDLSASGIQSGCQYPLDAGEVEVGVVLISNAPTNRLLSSFQFDLLNERKELLFPPAVPTPFLDSNPDFNDALSVPGAAPWNCDLVGVTNDTGTGPAGTTVSRIACFISGNSPPAPVLPGNATLLLATITFDIPDTAYLGNVLLEVSNVVAGDENGNEFAQTCLLFVPCDTAIIELVDPLLTPIAVATSTPTPAPIITPTPTP